jgi:hypothetical protein
MEIGRTIQLNIQFRSIIQAFQQLMGVMTNPATMKKAVKCNVKFLGHFVDPLPVHPLSTTSRAEFQLFQVSPMPIRVR